MERQVQGNLALVQSTPVEKVEWQAAIYWLYQEDEVSPTARYEKGQLHYTVTDQVGTITELMSETGYIDYRQKLSLWGEATIDGHRHSAANDSQALGCHHRFAGQYYDEESELHYNRFRYYSPETGQYLSHDPIGLLGGFNPYGYVFDPTGWIDPLGLNGCGASTPSTEPHGNSKDSTKTQHLYEIYDVETGDVLKTGISGSSLNKNGTSPRANRQVSKLNGPVDDAHPPKYAARIIDDSIPDRKTALQREVENAQKLHDEGNSMSLHKRPRPWEKQ